MQDGFPRSLAFTLSWEGGFVDHPADKGGPTNKGVTLATLQRFRPGATVADLKAITDTWLRAIYQTYWDEPRCDTLAAGVDGAVFDYSVNSGPAAARKSLLAVVGGDPADTVKKLCRKRLSIYQALKNWKTFGKGWTNRVTAGEALWTRWALAATTAPASVAVALKQESRAAGAAAKKQDAGAGAAGVSGAGGAAATPVAIDHADRLAGLVLAGCLAGIVILAAWLLWRAHVNRRRSAAFAAEAARI